MACQMFLLGIPINAIQSYKQVTWKSKFSRFFFCTFKNKSSVYRQIMQSSFFYKKRPFDQLLCKFLGSIYKLGLNMILTDIYFILLQTYLLRTASNPQVQVVIYGSGIIFKLVLISLSAKTKFRRIAVQVSNRIWRMEPETLHCQCENVSGGAITKH
jgi:hypothetical protein